MPIIKKTLEKIIGEERLERWSNSSAYRFVVESVAMNSFSYTLCTPIELGVAGMDFMEHLKTRVAAAITNTFTARPYGVVRDWFFRKIGITEESHWLKKYLGDSIAGIVMLPTYWLNAWLGGAEFDEIAIASVTMAPILGAIGRPYGWYLDKVRKQCGVPIGYETGDSGGEQNGTHT